MPPLYRTDKPHVCNDDYETYDCTKPTDLGGSLVYHLHSTEWAFCTRIFFLRFVSTGCLLDKFPRRSLDLEIVIFRQGVLGGRGGGIRLGNSE